MQFWRTKRISLKGLFLSFLLGGSGFVWANTASDVLIEKFQRIHLQLAPSDPSHTGITLRLADLLAERARVQAMAELEKGCVECLAGNADREAAVKYYLEALPKLQDSQKGRVLSQLGHLYELLGQSAKAIALYKDIIKTQVDPQAVAEAYLSMGEIYFKRHDFSAALGQYNQVLTIPSERRSLAAYRRAWCYFNLGKVTEAIDALLVILNDPKLLTRGNQGVVAVDEGYKAEVARDLATFMAKNGGGLNEAQDLFKHSPESVQLSNVAYFASELERLGQVKEAIAVYHFVVSKTSDPKLRLNHAIHLAELKKNLNQVEASLADFSQALSLWSSLAPCSDIECTEWKSRLRKYVLDWHHVEKKKPTTELFTAYQAYIKTFPQEVDMSLWAAAGYQVLENWVAAIKLYDQAVKLTVAGEAQKGVNNQEALPSLEDLLLTTIELAEHSKDQTLLRQAYGQYLKLSSQKRKEVEVRYQLAHLTYKAGNYDEAAVEFREVALMNMAQDLELKKQAADLALDALALLKDDRRLEVWASEFAQTFPKNRADYQKLSRQAILNQTAHLAKQDVDLLAAWATLQRMHVEGATAEMRISFLKNKLVLAEKLQKYAEAREAADLLLREKELAVEDRQYALSRKAWLAELNLDFKTALQVTSQMSLKELTPEQQSLKLALFAELSGQNSQPHYKNFIQHSKDKDQIYAIALKLVEHSSEPLKTLEQHKKILITKPEVYANQYLIHLKTHKKTSSEITSKEKDVILKDKALASTRVGVFFWRQNFLEEFAKVQNQLSQHELKADTQAALNRSLKRRVQLLEKMENLLNQAIAKEDWTAQMVAIADLAREADRFYQNLLSLPMPEGLSDQEQMQYMQLLSQQAAPYRQRADQLLEKSKEFWATGEVVERLRKQYAEADPRLRPILADEVKLIDRYAPDSLHVAIQAVTQVQEPKVNPPTVEELTLARQKVQESPMSRQNLEDLLQLERRMGREAMVSYLQSRINNLKE